MVFGAHGDNAELDAATTGIDDADQRCFGIAPNVTHENVDGETLIINLTNGNYYSLRGSGAHIWSIVMRGATVRDIQEAVARRYDGDRQGMDEAVEEFLSALQTEELIAPLNSHASERTARAHLSGETDLLNERPSFDVPNLDKYTDMKDLLLLDPIHEVDATGWPQPKSPREE